MNGLVVERSLFLRGGATFKGEVILFGAKVGGSSMPAAPPSRPR